jgi:hypothetical protein
MEGELHETNLRCTPLEFHLFPDLKSRKTMVSNVMICVQSGDAIFARAFSMMIKIHANLPVCLKFFIQHGSKS